MICTLSFEMHPSVHEAKFFYKNRRIASKSIIPHNNLKIPLDAPKSGFIPRQGDENNVMTPQKDSKKSKSAFKNNAYQYYRGRKNSARDPRLNVDSSKLPSSQEFCLLHFKKTKNNTYAMICQLFGKQKTLTSISGGAIKSGLKANGRRKTRFTQRMVFKYIVEKLLAYGFKYLVIHTHGPTLSKRYIFKNFYKRFRIILIKDLTSHAHNGCRSRAARRL